MLQKLERSLTEDIDPLLPAGVHFDEQEALKAFAMVWMNSLSASRAMRGSSRQRSLLTFGRSAFPIFYGEGRAGG
jgi:hypothetical protein